MIWCKDGPPSSKANVDIHCFSCFTCNWRLNCSHSGSHEHGHAGTDNDGNIVHVQYGWSRLASALWSFGCWTKMLAVDVWLLKILWLVKHGKTFEGCLLLVPMLIYRRATIFVFPSARGGLELIVGWEWTRCCIRFSIMLFFLLVLRDFVDIFAGILLVSSIKWW